MQRYVMGHGYTGLCWGWDHCITGWVHQGSNELGSLGLHSEFRSPDNGVVTGYTQSG